MNYKIYILESAAKYIRKLTESEQGIIKADIEALQSGDFESVRTKQLKSKIRELIVGHHRITYFQLRGGLYFIIGFRKKSAKTPKKEIGYAEKIYRQISK